MSSEIIGVDAAKLAGLQIDQLSKIRSGQLSLDQLERFLNLKPEDREERFGEKHPVPIVETAKPVIMTRPVPQFVFVADLGIITVPEDYNHATFLVSFRTRHQGGRKKSFWSYNEGITDANFRNPSRVLKSGDKLSVRAFRQIVSRTISKERMTFLKEQDAVLVGAQGAALVFDHKRDQLPKGYWYASLDEPDRLWGDADQGHRVPAINTYLDGFGLFGFDLAFFEDECFDDDALLVFCDVPAPSGA